ncbi:MAG: branched-chain amino acid ABC transporter substrate-binding protein [Thermoproteota archaeon]|nr:MAG: branched-chain amino acid ABC transporter substrate-binding protein [Candidatus Korarchaeota archaeon]
MKRAALSKVAAVALIVVIVVVAVVAWLALRPKGPAVKEVKIGVVLPLSGKLAETGADLKRGIEFAVEEINAAGGIKNLGGAEIRVVYGDSAGKPETGAAEAERLITEEKVVALLGAYQSAVTKTVSEVAERYKVPMLNPDSTSPALTERGYKWFFRTTPHDETFAAQHVEFLDYLNKKYGNLIKKVAIIHEDTEWGAKTAEAWQKHLKAHGYEVVKVVSYHAATVTSLDSEIETIKAANPDALFAASYVSDAILLVQTCKHKDFNPKLILAQDAGFINPSYVKEVGKDGFYIFSREVFNWDLLEKIPRLKAINDRYKAKYGVDLNGNSARDYTGVWVLYYAIEEAAKKASPENLEEFRKAIRDALAAIDLPADKIIMPWAGVKFDSKGQNIKGRGIIVQMRPEDGKYHTVYPPELATVELTFPMPTWAERGG